MFLSRWHKLFYGLVIIISMNIALNESFKCIYDSIAVPQVPVAATGLKQERGRSYRHNDDYLPLSIHYHFDDMDPHMTDNALFNIEMSLKEVIAFFQKTLKVKKTLNPFLIERDICIKRWTSGPNKFKCSKIKQRPEYCSLKQTDFIIPDYYLDKLDVYGINSTNPSSTIKAGAGINDKNFILFVISKSTSWCKEEGVQAYGSYCRLDNTKRPVAGLLNMCPEKFARKIYNPSYYYNVIMHEIIHILGFSHHLFDKFDACKSLLDCETPNKIVQSDKNSVQRLLFPEVVQSMKLHFKCSDSEFGAPLAETENSTSGKWSSHWHPLLMYSSLMTPVFTEDDYVTLDNITLALLASSGWYRVDFPQNSSFIFGKGEGCDFGFRENCRKSQHLCSPSDNSTGCDILHKTIGHCQQVVSYHSCGVFKPDENKSCLDEEGGIYNLDLRTVQHEKRCIGMQKQDDSVVPMCTVLKCNEQNKIEILVNKTWTTCRDKKAKIKDFTVDCPEETSLCLYEKDRKKKLSCDQEKNLTIPIRMFFSAPTFEELMSSNSFKNFEVSTVHAVASAIEIPVEYIFNATFNVFKEISLEFVVCPPTDLNQDQYWSAVSRTQSFLKKKFFAHVIKADRYLPVVSNDIALDPEAAVHFSDYEGLKMLLVLPIAFGVYVVAAVGAFLINKVMIERHRPKRKTAKVGQTDDQAGGSNL